MAPNPDDEFKDLWDAIEHIRREQSKTNSTLSRIETLLAERCMTRGAVMDSTTIRLSEVEKKMWFFSGAAVAVSTLLGWILKQIGTGSQ